MSKRFIVISRYDGKSKIRFDSYQTVTHVIVSVYQKGLKAADVTIDADAQKVEIQHQGRLLITLSTLFGSINADGVTLKVYGTKIELQLPKSNPGISWPTLLASTANSAASSSPTPDASGSTTKAQNGSNGPQTSGNGQLDGAGGSQGAEAGESGAFVNGEAGDSAEKVGQQNGSTETSANANGHGGHVTEIADVVSMTEGHSNLIDVKEDAASRAAGTASPSAHASTSTPTAAPQPTNGEAKSQITEQAGSSADQAGSTPQAPAQAKKKKDWAKIVEEEEEKDAEGKEAESKSVEAFFKNLYKDLDPDSRRAMMKSYSESGGTTLSTNWADIGNKKTPIHPPSGVEARKWES